MSRTEGRVEVKPEARRMWRIGGRRREEWRGLVDMMGRLWCCVQRVGDCLGRMQMYYRSIFVL